MPRVHGHRVTSTQPAQPKAPAKKPARTEAARPKHVDAYEAPAGSRASTPKVGVDAKGLSFAGKTGAEAVVEAANYIEAGGSPFAALTDAERETAFAALAKLIGPRGEGKSTKPALLQRSAAVTALLSLAGTAKAGLRDQAVNLYADVLGGERTYGLRMSMVVNLDAAKLPLTKQAAAIADQVRAQLLPDKPPYEEWFKGGKHTLNVRHYVMEDFWKQAQSAYQKRGFTVKEASASRVVLTKELTDPSGKHKPITANVTLSKGAENVFRDMKDPDTQMVVYSGHAQLGAVVSGSLPLAKGKMAGTKLVQLYQCRGSQTVGDVAARFPGAHTTATFTSSYDHDDNQVLTRTFEMIAARGDYGAMRNQLKKDGLWQTSRNYMLPDDARLLAARDEDRDGFRDANPVGVDRFFDPRRAKDDGGRTDYRPGPSIDPERISGEKVAHAISYANTAFYYFAEENRQAPLTYDKTDRIVPGGWFQSSGNEPIRVAEKVRDGKVWYEVSVNSRYADQSKEAISGLALYELQRHLCVKDHGKFTEADKLRGLQLVQGYVDCFVDYRESCEELMVNFGKAYGFKGVSWDVTANAAFKDGHDKMCGAEAIEYLRKNGVVAPS